MIILDDFSNTIDNARSVVSNASSDTRPWTYAIFNPNAEGWITTRHPISVLESIQNGKVLWGSSRPPWGHGTWRMVNVAWRVGNGYIGDEKVLNYLLQSPSDVNLGRHRSSIRSRPPTGVYYSLFHVLTTLWLKVTIWRSSRDNSFLSLGWCLSYMLLNHFLTSQLGSIPAPKFGEPLYQDLFAAVHSQWDWRDFGGQVSLTIIQMTYDLEKCCQAASNMFQ